MASVRFTDVQARPTEFLGFTSLTLEELQTLVPPFEAAFQAHMVAWRLDGKPRTARQFAVYKNCPLPTPEDRLFFLLTYLKTYALQVVQGRLILIEAPSPACHRGMLITGNYHSQRGGDLRRFYTKQPPFSCGIDLHARPMDVCILDQAGETLLHRNMTATPEALLKAMVPSRDQIVLAAACLLTWYWLADLCAAHGMPFVLGHALSLQAIHGGKAKNDTIDAHKQLPENLSRKGFVPIRG